jgi:hypothetical protein
MTLQPSGEHSTDQINQISDVREPMRLSRREPAGEGDSRPRECGDCNVCCTAMHVAALDKPAGTPCEHQADAGCGIYQNRPSVCRNWYCMWIRDRGSVFAEDERPDKLGVFFTAGAPLGKSASHTPNRLAGVATPLNRSQQQQVIYAHPIRPDGADSVAARVVIQRLRRALPVNILPYRPPSVSFTAMTRDGCVLSEVE